VVPVYGKLEECWSELICRLDCPMMESQPDLGISGHFSMTLIINNILRQLLCSDQDL
jgi:hypothetical protein